MSFLTFFKKSPTSKQRFDAECRVDEERRLFPTPPTTLELEKKPSLEYLQTLQKDLATGNLPDKNDVLINAIIRAQDSVIHEKSSIDEILNTLTSLINTLGKLEAGAVFEYRDEQGMTSLHHLVKLGDPWCSATKVLCETHPHLIRVPNENSLFPLGLAADIGIDTCATLMDYKQKAAALRQCLTKKHEKQYASYKKEDLNALIKNTPDPSIIKITCLAAYHEQWKSAYKNLRLFGPVQHNKYWQAWEKNTVAPSNQEIDQAIQANLAKKTQESLLEPTNKDGNTLLHNAYSKKALITIKAILKKCIEDSIASNENPQTGINKLLFAKNFIGKTPVDCESEDFTKAVQNNIISELLQDFNTTNPSP